MVPSGPVHTLSVRRLVPILIVFAVALAPSAASALCLTQSIDDAVNQSDAVLVGTIVDARSLSHRIGPHSFRGGGILVRLDVEQALKGSPQVGQGFVLGSCIPPPAGPYARKAARSLIGTRGLFLIQVPQDGRPSAEPQEAVAPHLSMDDQIARARVDLGIASLADRIRPFRVETAVAGIVLLGMLIALLIVWKRRRTAATTAA